MKMRNLAIWALILAFPQAAVAGLEICNATKVEQSIAIGYKTDDVWISEGWWNAAPGTCVQPVLGPLANRYYYVQALADGYEFQAEDYSFCVTRQEFTIEGDSNCVERGYSKSNFIEVDTGETATHFTKAITPQMSLKMPAPDTGGTGGKSPEGKEAGRAKVKNDTPDSPDRPMPEAAEAGALSTGMGPTEGAEPFTKIGHFQTCEMQDDQRVCSFHVEGWKFYAYGGGLTPADMMQGLAGLDIGAPVKLTGDILYYGDITAEIVARNVVPMPGSDPHGVMWGHLQGDWVSLEDPASKMKITGLEMTETYGNDPIGVQFLQLADSCEASGGSGPVLYQTNPEDQELRCYLVARADGDNLDLIYLARGTTLRYGRP